MQGQRKQSELDKKSYDDLLRERDILSKVCIYFCSNAMVILIFSTSLGSEKSGRVCWETAASDEDQRPVHTNTAAGDSGRYLPWKYSKYNCWSRYDTKLSHFQNHKEEVKKQRQMLQALERERDRYGKEASDVQQKCIEQVPHPTSLTFLLLI